LHKRVSSNACTGTFGYVHVLTPGLQSDRMLRDW